MKPTSRITLIAALAALAAVGLQAAQPAGGNNSGGTTTGGTTTGGTTTGATTSGGSTTGGSTTGGNGNSANAADNNGKAKGKDEVAPTTGNPNAAGGNPNAAGGNPNAAGGNPNAADNNGKAPTTPPGTSNATGKDKEKIKGPNENASDNAKAVHAVLDTFKAQRDEYLADRKALLEKLKTATEAEKKAILEQLRTESQAREEEERSLGKQIREELKKLRVERKGGE